MTFEEAIEKVNILVISNNYTDYEEVRNMGFKNISYFKSIIVADKYFKEHQEDLNKYNLIIKGEQKVQRVCFYGDTDLDSKIDRSPTEVGNISIYNFSDHKNFHLWFNHESYTSDAMSITLNIYLDKLLKRDELCAKIQNQEIAPINISEAPRKPYPKSKKDLRILFLVSGVVYNENIEKSAEELGIDVTFVHDNNNALGQNVIHHMGEYDIIIASDCYSENLLDMNEEFREQGILTGLRLGVVATYENDSILTNKSDGDYTFDLHGYELIYQSRLGARESINKELNKDIYRVLRHPGYLAAKSIIERALLDYHNELRAINGVGLIDVDPENFKHYTEDYDKVSDKYDKEIENFQEKIRLYDSIVEEVKKYLHYKKKGYIKTSLNDLSIKETENGIEITAFTLGRRICVLTISKNKDNKNRVFTLQSMKDNGSLSGPCELSLYPLEKKLDATRPSEKQISVLSGLWKKIEKNLVPINNSCDSKYPRHLKKTPNNRRKPRHKNSYSY